MTIYLTYLSFDALKTKRLNEIILVALFWECTVKNYRVHLYWLRVFANFEWTEAEGFVQLQFMVNISQ